jgi:hypothetical protein
MTASRLQYLRDVQLPPDPGWWPPAPGWWMLAALALLAVAWGLRLLYLRAARHRPYRFARQELSTLTTAYERGAIDARTFVDAANGLVKRVCIHVRGDAGVARLSDAEWLSYLDHITDSDRFSHGPGQVLGSSRYAPQFAVDASQLRQALDALLGRLEASA